MRPARLEGQPGYRAARRVALLLDDAAQRARPGRPGGADRPASCTRCRSRHRGPARAARRRARRGCRACSPSTRRAATSKRVGVEDLRADVRVQPAQVQHAVVEHPVDRRRGRPRRPARSRTSGPRGRSRCTRGCAPRRRPSPGSSPAAGPRARGRSRSAGRSRGTSRARSGRRPRRPPGSARRPTCCCRAGRSARAASRRPARPPARRRCTRRGTGPPRRVIRTTALHRKAFPA